MYRSHFSRCPKIIQTSFHLYPLHKHRCHERRPRLTPAPSASLFSHCGIFSKLFNTINSIHRVEVSLKKSEGAQEQEKGEGKRKRLQCSQDMGLFLGTINQDGVDRTGPPPPAEPVWGGLVGSVWNDSTSLCWSMGQWRSTQLSQSPGDHTAHQRSFISTTPPAHTHHDLRKASNKLGCVPGPLERGTVCVCVWDSFAFSKQCKCEIEWEFFQL